MMKVPLSFRGSPFHVYVVSFYLLFVWLLVWCWILAAHEMSHTIYVANYTVLQQRQRKRRKQMSVSKESGEENSQVNAGPDKSITRDWVVLLSYFKHKAI